MIKFKNSLHYYFLEIRFRSLYLFLSFTITFVISYIYSFDLIFLIVQPISSSKLFIFTDPTEALSTTIKICLITTLHTLIPLFLYNIWSFVVPGFFKKERKKFNIFLFFTFFFMLFGESFIFFKLLPEIFNFLYCFEIKKEILTIQLEARIYSFVSFAIKLYLYTMIFFFIPLIFFLLFEYKILTTKNVISFRKFFYFFSLLLAAFISPPDIISQFTVAFFFSITYEIGLVFGFILEKKYKMKNLNNSIP